VTVDEPDREHLSARLLSGLGYTGLAEIEFMYDTKDTRFELIEVNPRLWGWHSLSAYAGVDLPYLAYCDTLQQEYAPGSFRSETKWIRMTGDFPIAIQEIAAGRLSVGDYLRTLRGSRDAVISWRDPLPILAEIMLILQHNLKGSRVRR
jgi:D-aspartate ligase